MDKHLHIITHEIPWPADYGGVYDLFHKIKALHAAGVRIHLHCFHAGPLPNHPLAEYCEEVQIYPRKKGWRSVSLRLPYIVSSRKSRDLVQRLQKDDYPILFEGIHTTHSLHAGYWKNRKVFIRLHNVEHLYYQKLFRHEQDYFKKIYYLAESRLLMGYEKSLANKAPILAVSDEDAAYYRLRMNAKDVRFLPAFIPWQEVKGLPGSGTYCLYHANLGISENARAAEWLLNEVFHKLDIPFVVAGRNPDLRLQTLAHSQPHTCIVNNPGEKEMQDMIAKAHIHIMPSLNETGVKLKLLNALYNGRYCISNQAGMRGSGLEGLCPTAEHAEDFRKIISRLFDIAYPAEASARRTETLQALYNNGENARKLITWIY